MSRLVVVTGGGGGIGRATAARFAALGDEVLAPGRADLDVTDETSVAAFFEPHAVDVLVNNAGIGESAPLAPHHARELASATSPSTPPARSSARARSSAGCASAARGAIVTVASTAGERGAPYTAAYTASKHAAVGLMRARPPRSRHRRDAPTRCARRSSTRR